MAITTVIIPAGPRHVHLLPRAVESVRRQTVSAEVLTFIDTEQRGPAYGRNRLAEQVTTPFLTLLDADDELEPTFVEEALKAWKPGSYVTSDWYHGDRTKIAHARSCYPFPSREGEMSFQLPVCLFPTAFWKKLGGMDETLFGAEDTDFFFKANARLIRSIVVRKPLFVYTGDGFRSKEAAADERWRELVRSVYKRYTGEFSMGCCGDPADQKLVMNVSTSELTLLVRPVFSASQLYRGRVTGHKYGRIDRTRLLYIHPEDFDARDFRKAEDWEAISPTAQQIEKAKAEPAKRVEDLSAADRKKAEAAAEKKQEAIDRERKLKADAQGEFLQDFDRMDVSQMEQAIKIAGVREWTADGQHKRVGFDMQQTPSELAAALVKAVERGVKRVIEVGTGESAGLARFMVEVLGWEVISIDISEPKTELYNDRRWAFIKADTQKKLSKELDSLSADLVIIDGGHEFAEAENDWKKFAHRAPMVIFHDIAPAGWWGADDKSGGFWRSISRGPKGGMKKGYSEIIAPLDTKNKMSYNGRQGIGVFINE